MDCAIPPCFESGIEIYAYPAGDRTKRETLISSHKYCSWRAVCKALSMTFSFSCSGSLLFSFALWTGLNASSASAPAIAPSVTFQRSSTAYLETAGDLKQRQIAFLNRIRKADPQRETIERALFNQQNELGLILNRSVELDKIPALMRSMLVQMARVFPGQDLTVLAYTPSNPPRKIATARLNARTRDMTYTPER
jgi:hypothetical protein